MSDIILKFVTLGFVDSFVQAVAKGEHGGLAQEVYLFLQGKKTMIGFVFSATATAVLSTGHVKIAAGLYAASFLLIRIGLVDAAWRSSATYADWKFFRFLRTWSPFITGALGLVLTACTTCDAGIAQVLGRVHLSCVEAGMVVTALTAELQYAVGKAKLETTPDEKGLVLQVTKD